VTVAIELDNRSSSALDEAELRRVLQAALAAEGIDDGEVGVALVDEQEMAELNDAHRGKPVATDVLSFPLDGRDAIPGDLPRQLGDLVICPARAEADGTPVEVLVVHGALHLLGWDHETDGGEMLDRQAAVLEEVAGAAGDPS
jgi:probable rRNA maturation factor